MAMTRPKMFAIFLGIGLGLSGLIVALFPGVWGTVTPEARAVSIVHLMPLLFATLLVQGPLLKQPVLEPLGMRFRPNRWFGIAWLSPVLVLAVALGVLWTAFGFEPVLDTATYLANKRSLLSGEELVNFDRIVTETPPQHPFYLVLQGLPVGITLNLLIALSTEIAFRGFLFREVQGNFWRRAAIIGLAEAAWLAPPAFLGFYFPENPLIGGVMAILFSFAVSPVLIYIRVRSESVVACAAFRGTVMALTAIAAELAFGAEDWLRPFHGLTGILGLVVLLGLFWVHDQKVAKQSLMKA